MEKRQQMHELYLRAEALAAIICEPRSKLVWGQGNLNSPIAIIGEAPGAKETELQIPFVGISGTFLMTELMGLGIARDEIYLSNIVKCRPVNTRSSRLSNRPPTPQEIDQWKEILYTELEILSPKVILCLGSHAANALIHFGFKMEDERGQWFNKGEIRLIATYHPSYVSRFGKGVRSRVTEDFRADLKEAIEEAFHKRQGD